MDRRGYFTTLHDGRAYPESYLDSGTMTFIVGNGGIPRCARMPWAFCLDPSHEFAATMIDEFGGTVSTSFAVGDYQAIGDHHLGAADGAAIAAVAGTMSFVWGAPFLFGKRIALFFDEMSVPGDPGRTGPFFAVR